MNILEQNDRYTVMGSSVPLVYLYPTKTARPEKRNGLYHVALLVPSREALGNIFQHLLDTKYPLAGASDHFVSEAIYLQDPEGNGIEIYHDRPSAEWTYQPNGYIDMGTINMDFHGVMKANENRPFNGISPETIVGHVHLSIEHMEESIEFYRDVFGMDLMTRYGSQASFISAAGYHHHMGMNTWEHTHGALSLDEPGLRKFEINIPNSEDFEYFKQQIVERGLTTEQDGDAEIIRDPNGIGIRVMYQKDSIIL